MDRVAFLLESGGPPIRCLLNPETLVVRRLAGIRARRSVSGLLTRAGLRDDPLLYTGGGTTELTLDLLFDISLAGPQITTQDVRDLTRPLWNLAENTLRQEGPAEPPLVRFVWGKAWNIPGLVVAVAERFEDFSVQGVPARSWLRMRLLRVSEYGPAGPEVPTLGPTAPEGLPPPGEQVLVHQVVGGGATPTDDGLSTLTRMDLIAYGYCGQPWWKPLAGFNNIDDPLHVPPGTLLRLPRNWLSGGKA